MGSYTAQLLIGTPHPFHDGIVPTHMAFLSENDRPAWELFEWGDGISTRVCVWIPTVEHTLDDAMALVALRVMGETLSADEAANAVLRGERVEMYDLDELARSDVYGRCQQVELPKLVVTVLRGSLIESQLDALDHYRAEVELCTASDADGHGPAAKG